MTRGFGRQGLLRLAALAAAACGVVALVFAILSQKSAPEPPASAHGTISFQHPTSPPRVSTDPSASDSTPTTGDSPPKTAGASNPPERAARTLPRSSPTTIDIPAIDVHSSVVALGRNADGSLAVPQPGPDLDKVAWYNGSVTPGETGPSVLEGHVDSVQGPSIFYRLGAMRPGNNIHVTRADGSTAIFTVNAVRSYATHGDFPAQQVFGADLAYPTLRLITCSNFNSSSGHYEGNTVVYAHLTSTRALPRRTS